jgi:NAD(P)-dependent dehydrogenase (short-subunit alcohol dehydrogenase family)
MSSKQQASTRDGPPSRLGGSWIHGKTCLITGANAGIGKEVTRTLATLGARVVMVCRDREKGERARDEIVASARPSDPGAIELLTCDLASLKDVRRLASDYLASHDRLHVLVNNAGVFSMKRTMTVDGYESTFAVDYLAHFYLTELLIGTLKASAPARVVNMASDIHKYFGIGMGDLLSERRYNGQKAYSNAKAAMVLFTRKLAHEMEGTGVTVNAVHPGHARTQMTTMGLPRWFVAITSRFQMTPEDAATTPVHVASSPEVSGVTGAYFVRCKVSKPARFTGNVEMQQHLWDASRSLIEKAIGSDGLRLPPPVR